MVETLSEIAPDYEVIVVDDGSTDHTGEITDALSAVNPHIRVVHNRPNKGLWVRADCRLQRGHAKN